MRVRLQARLKNDTVLAAIERLGYRSVGAFIRENELSIGSVYDVIALNYHKLPRIPTENGTIGRMALLLSLDIEELIPTALAGQKLVTVTDMVAEVSTEKLLEAGRRVGVAAIAAPDMNIENADEVQKLLESLTERERHVIERRYAVNGAEFGTLGEIGKEIGRTRECVRMIEAKAIWRIRHPKTPVHQIPVT